jgi:hypothetical protein
MNHPLSVLKALLRGEGAALPAVANTLRAEAFGITTFGRTDTLDLFATHALLLSPEPLVLHTPQALVLLDSDDAGRTVGVFADVADGIVARLWVVADTAADARSEPAVAVARDDFMNQQRTPVQGEAADHPGLDARAWSAVQSLGQGALAAADCASSSQAVVMRAFSTGHHVAALLHLRLLAQGVPRQAHRRLALATAQLDGAGAVLHSRLALSGALPTPAAVVF